MDDSQAYVLPKLTDIFQRSDSEEISRELKLLRTQCQNIVDSEISRVSARKLKSADVNSLKYSSRKASVRGHIQRFLSGTKI